MMRVTALMPTLWAVFSLFIISESTFAQGKSANAPGHIYGLGFPKSSQDLPPGQLRNSLDVLPPEARGKALGWLQEFSFPAEDVKSLRVNSKGEVHYADTFLPDQAGAPAANDRAAASSAISAGQAFQLHSRPGSSNVVYLDFDGHAVAGTAWSSTTLVALPFDPSENDNPATEANFTQDELNRIHEIWHRMSEDFAAFNIDVTTEEPAVYTSTTGHVLFTHTHDANGRSMPSNTSGGVAYVNVFGNSNYAYYSPALVYYSNLSTSSYGVPSYNAETGSHEFGHNIGLSHDGIIGGTNYYQGHGSGLVSWAPIMGNSYYNNITQWSKGEYAAANNSQDDLAIIAGEVGYVGDDHGDSAAQATALLVEDNGDILVSSPELDPENVLTENKGIIDDSSDVDWFFLDIADGGPLHITATPAWHSFTQDERRGVNLDIELALFDSDLVLLAVGEPHDNTNATVTTAVTAGRYYLQVNGTDNSTNSDYSDYNSMGMFFLEGSVPAGSSDSTPPSPATMSWQSAPQATGPSTISMTAVEATDDSGNVEYYFTCVAGGSGCTDSGWQSSRSHSAGGLSAATFYAYTVKARDVAGNQNSNSSSMGDTTEVPPANQAPLVVASYSPDPAVINRGKTVNVTLDGSGSSDPDGSIVAWSWEKADGTIIDQSAAVTVRLREGDHEYTLTVTDNNGATNSASLSISVTKSSGGGGGGGGGKPPKK